MNSFLRSAPTGLAWGLVLLAAAAEASGGVRPAKWTFLVYMVGDNDLEDYVTIDLETEMAAVGSTDDVHVLALADRTRRYSTSDGNWTDTKLFYVTKGMKATSRAAVEDWGEQNMGDPRTLWRFLQYAQEHHPAERYALIFWNHGWGWRPYQTMWDQTDDDTLDMHEVVSVLALSLPIDVIAYDACAMQDIEVLASLRPFAKAFVGSQDDVGYEGFRYEEVLADLTARPEMSAAQLAVSLGRSMRDRTCSVVALNSDFDALVSAADRWSVALAAAQADERPQFVKAYLATQNFSDPLFVDLFDAANQLSTQVDDLAVRETSQAVMDGVRNVVLYEWHRNFFEGAHGINIFWPQTPGGLDEPSSPQWNDFEYYRDYLAFSDQTRWDEFLAAYVARAPRTAPRSRPLSPLEQAILAVKSGAEGFGVPEGRGYASRR